MQLLLFQTFSIAVALALGVFTSALWWSHLREPWLFLVVGTFAMLGLERLVTATWTCGQLIFGGWFLEIQPPLTAEQISNSELRLSSFLISLVVLALGLPLLFWLRRATSRA